MFGVISKQHIIDRLKTVHTTGISIMIMFFLVLLILDAFTETRTLYAQLILLAMAIFLALSYLTLLIPKKHEPATPLFTFFILNICTTALVWATGILQSPFILLYCVLIMVTSELYHYRYGLLQTVLALLEVVIIYGATTNGILPFQPLLPYTNAGILFQPTLVILMYGLLYAILLLYTSLSSSSARMVLYRSYNKLDLDITYQEKIIQDMPLGILVVDHGLTILGANPMAMIKFPFKGTAMPLTNYLSLSKTSPLRELKRLANSGEEKQLIWKTDTGEATPATVSIRLLKSERKDGETFIIFVK